MPDISEESPERGRLVRTLIGVMGRDGWQVTHAAAEGYERPGEVDGAVPDVVAMKDGVLSYGKAETCESFQSQRSIVQIRLLSGRTMQGSGKSITLYLIVPRACYRDLLQTIDAAFSRRDILAFSG